jgi:hypothetical protein
MMAYYETNRQVIHLSKAKRCSDKAGHLWKRQWMPSKRVIWPRSQRLIPFAIICYFVAYLDRVNLSFAALEMNKDLHFTATV